MPGFDKAIRISRTYRGILSAKDNNEVLKRLGLSIDQKRYYNLHRKEITFKLSNQEEAQMLLHYLNGRKVHVEVLEEYVLDGAGNKVNRVILCIAWWTPEQV